MSGTTGTVPLTTVVADQLITAAERNAELANIGSLMDASGCGGHSDTDSDAQIQTAPYPGSVLSKATSIAGELERLRYQLAQMLGTDYWYKPAATDLTSVGNVVVPVGGIIDYAGYTTPPNSAWHFCDGTAISRAAYPELFTLIGTQYGAGNGTTTFNIPNYTDRVSISSGNLYVAGDTGGSVAGALTANVTDPGHTHTQNSHTHTMGNHTHTGDAHTHTIPRDGWGTGAAGTVGRIVTTSGSPQATGDTTSGAASVAQTGTPSTNTSDAATATNNSNTTGITVTGTAATLPPYISMYKIIRLL